ncbi:MAG TPA: conjugal transfer protein MobC [Puia sp.]
MNTGENEQGLRKILDMTRMISIVLLLLHFYYTCFAAFTDWNLRAKITDRVLINLIHTGFFSSMMKTKSIALGFLVISLIGARGRKNEKLKYRSAFIYIANGIIVFYGSVLLLKLEIEQTASSMLYMLCCSFGYIFILTGGTLLSRVITQKLNSADIFNKENETFPQEERLLANEYSINLPAEYFLRNKKRKSWINIINPFRGLLVIGSPGSGKSYFIIQHIIKQHIEKGFAMFVYDFKFDDLSVIVYNHFLKNKNKYKIPPKFYIIDFDDLSRANRCNPLEPATMYDITDAAESARTIMLAINKEWIKRQGDFFVESPINFLTAIIWFLRKYQEGEFCTLPHVIELMQMDYYDLFSILRTEKEIEVLINPFITALENDVMEQLEGQTGAAKIALAKLSSPNLYYVLSGNEFTLDINNPLEPKIICAGNNPQKQLVYGPILSLYVTRFIKLVNKKGKQKCSLIFDEFPTIYINHMDSLIATARSNRVATTLAVQDFSQLKKDYGRDNAEVIMNITGNVISGQVMGETAKQLSERIGKIMQDKESFSINSSDISISRSRQLESAVPPSKIAGLSSGEFVGMVADEPEMKIELKAFHAEIINDHDELQKQKQSYRPLPTIRTINRATIEKNYLQIKQETEDIFHAEVDRILQNPLLQKLVLKRGNRRSAFFE